jgi:multiple sugar transport system permease protein
MFVAALALAVVYLFPLYWMYVTSLQPANPDLNVYPEVWVQRTMQTFLWNSTLIAAGVTVISALFGTGAAYVLARYRNIWIDNSLFLILMVQVLPSSVMVTPLYVGFFQVGLLAYPRTAVILASAAKALPFYVVLVRASFMSVPRELEEAALVDGNSRIGAFFRIVLPLARNGILVCSILIFMHAFGEYIYSTSLIQDPALQPASVGLSGFLGPNTNDWKSIMAYSAIYVTPILAVFVLLQRRIIAGLTSGALK